MKKIIVLIIFLITPLLASSQTRSNDSLVTVPIKTLRNALIVKSERDYLKSQILLVRDSVSILNNTISYKDSTIKNLNQSIIYYKQIDLDRQQQLSYKDKIIDNYKTQIKKEKKKTYITGGSFALLSLLLLL